MSAETYAQKALNQIPRLIGNQDRNPFSPTYGCFHRDYWLDKTSDFPDAVRQFAIHALALVYKHNFPGSIYQGQPKIRDWAIAGLDYWTSIQHREGSFDEFYPYERGWVGPTAFTTFTSIEAYKLLEDEIPTASKRRIQNTIAHAAHFIAKGEAEQDHLANHHAMACLAVWKAYELLKDPKLKAGFERLWQTFLTYHHPAEGWSREYDGIDPGYLSATVSFLGKLYQANRNPGILEVLRQSVECCSYFVYPNGFYAGSIGSRNTLHFYPHGFEIMANEVDLAGAIAEKMLQALAEDKLVPPEIISDRYVVYRVPEFLQAYLDYTARPADLPPLPYEREPFTCTFEDGRIFIKNTPKHYIVANLAKGGVFKVFDRTTGDLVANDCGLAGVTQDGKVISSQWVDPAYQHTVTENGWTVSGNMNIIPTTKLFTPLRHILFRSTLVILGWNPRLAHWLKGQIRKTLILGQNRSSLTFRRELRIEADTITQIDHVQNPEHITFTAFQVGDEIFMRYVPQSRYFQSQELLVSSVKLSPDELAKLNERGGIEITQEATSSQRGNLAQELDCND